ncbi:hypothetical protein ACFRCQ_19790 [Cytobacillus firmus]
MIIKQEILVHCMIMRDGTMKLTRHMGRFIADHVIKVSNAGVLNKKE